MSGYWADPEFKATVDTSDPLDKKGLLLAEDDALKWYLSGLSVPTNKGPLEVGTWFRFPEGERRTEYPFITIDFLGINPSYERWTSVYRVDPDDAQFTTNDGTLDHTGLYTPSVSPTLGLELTDNQGVSVDPYLMYRLLYQVTVHSRSALHDRILTSRFITDVFPPRPFWIPVDADHTWRRAELLEMTPNDTLETTESGSKRIFRKAFTIVMDAELLQSQATAVEKARTLHVDFYKSSDINQPVEVSTHLSTDSHTLGEPVTIDLTQQP